jgi:hemolysin activation/secretion protein
MPRIEGLERYSPQIRQAVLAACLAIDDPVKRLQACAAALTAMLVTDGFINTRVFVVSTAGSGVLEVVDGRLVEVRVEGPDERLNRRVRRLVRPLVGDVLRLQELELTLQRLNLLPGIGSVRGSVNRLGSDVSQAVFVLRVQASSRPWQGDISLRNDGNSGSGEARGVVTLVKTDLATRGDTLLVYGELDSSDAPALGSLISSISYSLPLADQLSLTGAFGASRRNLIELAEPLNGISTTQLQGLGQLEWVFHETLSQRWSMFAGLSANGSTTTLDGANLPSILPAVTRTPRSGYLRTGVSSSWLWQRIAASGNVYLLQGLGFATPADQRQELQSVGISPGQATAIGSLISGAWNVAPDWQLLLRGGGQLAFRPLTSPMQFTLGSDVGIRGLPGQLVSGDSGWLASGEVAWSFWRNKRTILQLVPFFGAGGVSTSADGLSFNDTVGAGGLFVRWLQGSHWTTELGWINSFDTTDNGGPWTSWLLGKGLYAKLQFRF